MTRNINCICIATILEMSNTHYWTILENPNKTLTKHEKYESIWNRRNVRVCVCLSVSLFLKFKERVGGRTHRNGNVGKCTKQCISATNKQHVCSPPPLFTIWQGAYISNFVLVATYIYLKVDCVFVPPTL